MAVAVLVSFGRRILLGATRDEMPSLDSVNGDYPPGLFSKEKCAEFDALESSDEEEHDGGTAGFCSPWSCTPVAAPSQSLRYLCDRFCRLGTGRLLRDTDFNRIWPELLH